MAGEGAMFTNSKEFLSDYKEEIRNSIPSELPTSVGCSITYIIEQLYDESLTVADVKDACDIKSKDFSSRFSLFAGATPKQFILKHRIKIAKYLLRETTHTVAQVGFLVGFSSHSSFSKAFKNSVIKESPSEWKRKNSRTYSKL